MSAATARGAAVAGAAPGHAALDDAEITDRIRRYKAGEERAIIPVVEHFKHRVQRQAGRIARDTHGRIDASDIESAAVAAMFAALDRFDPDAGVPFGAFFKQYRRAAVNDERSTLAGGARLARHTFDDTGNVLKAVEGLKQEQARARAPRPTPGATGTEGGRQRATPFALSERFTEPMVADLFGREPKARTTALATLFAEVDRYLTDALPEGTSADARRHVAVERLTGLRKGARPRSRLDVETALAGPLTYVVEVARRRGEVPMPKTTAAMDEWYAAIAERAGTSPEQARHLLSNFQSVVSIDAESSGAKGGKGGSLVERLGTTDDRESLGDRFSQFAHALDLVPAFPRLAYAMHKGAFGYRPFTLDQLAAGFGMSATQADLLVGVAHRTLQSVAVRDLLFGRSDVAFHEVDARREVEDAVQSLAVESRDTAGASAAPARRASARPGRVTTRRATATTPAVAELLPLAPDATSHLPAASSLPSGSIASSETVAANASMATPPATPDGLTVLDAPRNGVPPVSAVPAVLVQSAPETTVPQLAPDADVVPRSRARTREVEAVGSTDGDTSVSAPAESATEEGPYEPAPRPPAAQLSLFF